MLKILLPVDFSEKSTVATEYALTLLAQVPEAHLLLLHCFHDYLTDGIPSDMDADLTTSEVITERVLNRNKVEEEQLLDELYTSILSSTRASGQKLNLERAFVYGLPEDVIPEQIKGYKPALVVMGTEAETNLARSIFGTIITHVLDEISVPLLSVPLHYAGGPIRNVLYATDFDKADKNALEALQQLLEPFNVRTFCVHISDGTTATDSEKLEALHQNLQQRNPTGNINYILLEGDDVAAALQEFVTRENINLLALTTRERDMLDNILHPSLAKKLVLESKVPLLIFHSHTKL